MSEESNSQVGSGRVLLPTWGWVALVAAFIFVVPEAGLVAAKFGWNRTGVKVFAWAVMAAVALVVTLHYSNPSLPTFCGAMIGFQSPRPSDGWFRQLAGDEWGRALYLALTVATIAIGIAVFGALAKRRGAASES
jgi:hypothetical protein